MATEDSKPIGEQYLLFSEDGMAGVTVTITGGRDDGFQYSVLPCTDSTSGWASSVEKARTQARAAAEHYFKAANYKDTLEGLRRAVESAIRRAEK